MTLGKALIACAICIGLAFGVNNGLSLTFTWLCFAGLMAWGLSIKDNY